jgi:RNA polymerase sigma factor (sigma-70 family)
MQKTFHFGMRNFPTSFILLSTSGEMSKTHPSPMQTWGRITMLLQVDSASSTNHDHSNNKVRALSETKLLADAKSGKSEAFEALCEPYNARLFNAALRITRNREDAEDAVQNSLLQAFIHIKNFRGNSSFSTWLTRIVINSALMIRRKGNNARLVFTEDSRLNAEGKVTFQIPDRSPNPEQSYAAQERTRMLHKAISRLRPRIREVIEVGQLRELPIKETARVLDISVAAAKGRFFHARAVLRRSALLRSMNSQRTEPAA